MTDADRKLTADLVGLQKELAGSDSALTAYDAGKRIRRLLDEVEELNNYLIDMRIDSIAYMRGLADGAAQARKVDGRMLGAKVQLRVVATTTEIEVNYKRIKITRGDDGADTLELDGRRVGGLDLSVDFHFRDPRIIFAPVGEDQFDRYTKLIAECERSAATLRTMIQERGS